MEEEPLQIIFGHCILLMVQIVNLKLRLYYLVI